MDKHLWEFPFNLAPKQEWTHTEKYRVISPLMKALLEITIFP